MRNVVADKTKRLVFRFRFRLSNASCASSPRNQVRPRVLPEPKFSLNPCYGVKR